MTTHTLLRRTFSGRRRASGLSLIELMVALTLGLFLIAGMLTLLARNSNTRAELDKAGRQIENGRYAAQRISEDLHNAGFYGEFYGLPTPGTSAFPATLPDPCDTGYATAAFKNAKAFPVQGVTAVTSAAAAAMTCIDAANFSTGAFSSVLVVRFASPATTLPTPANVALGSLDWAPNATAATAAIATLDAATLYVQSNVDDVSFATKSNAATNFATLKVSTGSATNLINAPVYRYITRIYFLSPCSRPSSGTVCSAAADGGSPIPTLKMVELLGSGASAVFSDPVPIAEGIEAMAFDYGLDSNADGSPDTYVDCSACSVTDWGNVVAVRVNLVARNTEASPDYTDAKTYALGLAGTYTPSTADKRYKRHLYQLQVRLNNQSMRREQ
jgi:type IV pilus assembly protein PilW